MGSRPILIPLKRPTGNFDRATKKPIEGLSICHSRVERLPRNAGFSGRHAWQARDYSAPRPSGATTGQDVDEAVGRAHEEIRITSGNHQASLAVWPYLEFRIRRIDPAEGGSMSNVLVVLFVAALVFGAERLWPNVKLERVPHWYARAFLFNSVQAAIAMYSIYLWDVWFARFPLLSISSWPIALQVLTGYLTITFVYYWWHRARHSIPLLWRFLHQLHHSPARMELITSFYKNPIEILLNGILSSAILYVLLGLSATGVGLTVLATGLAEFVYHMNIRTPHVMGLFFQRPEMHRIHHQRGLHHFNYSDLPVWDMLFGTYRNPAVVINQTGFPNDNENRVGALLRGIELES